ncbi:hypothetical protein MTR_8g072033 [Medicago truncatula]|uniref:Uncharacterized protein n=1 Tax=Medicago truncatula TaxID=3880 RepID=A0A072TS37_MEDTR|nr:hypothetical protein MTR_8g072033 [Medicago truncatula]
MHVAKEEVTHRSGQTMIGLSMAYEKFASLSLVYNLSLGYFESISEYEMPNRK